MKAIGKFAETVIVIVYIIFWMLSALVLAVSLVTTVVFRQYEQNDLFDFVSENIPLLLLSMLAFFALMLAAQVLSERNSRVCRILFPGKPVWKISFDNRSGRSPQHLICSGTGRKKSDTGADKGRSSKTEHEGSDRKCAPFPWLMLVVAGVVSLFLVLAVRGLPTADAALLDDVIEEFMEGDYSSMTTGYLANYPFQIFYVYFGEILKLLFGENDTLIWQLLNVISIEFFMYFLYQITWELFENTRVCLIMQVLSCGAFCLYAFSTFVYFDLISMALQTAALYLQILFMKREKIRYEVGAGVCISVAVLMKMNCLIALIAMILFLIVDAVWKIVRDNNQCSGDDTTNIPDLSHLEISECPETVRDESLRKGRPGCMQTGIWGGP